MEEDKGRESRVRETEDEVERSKGREDGRERGEKKE